MGVTKGGKGVRLGSGYVVVDADTNKLKKGLNEAQSKTLFTMKNMKIAVAGFAVAAVAATAVIVKMTLAAAQQADVIGKTADKIGITTKSLQELRYAAGLSGMSVSELDNNMMIFTKRLGNAKAGIGE